MMGLYTRAKHVALQVYSMLLAVVTDGYYPYICISSPQPTLLHLVNKFPAFYVTRMYTCSLVTIRSHANPVHAPNPTLFLEDSL
jgi:hypothetical protein